MNAAHGGSAGTTAGGWCSGRKRGKDGKNPGPLVHDDRVRCDVPAGPSRPVDPIEYETIMNPALSLAA